MTLTAGDLRQITTIVAEVMQRQGNGSGAIRYTDVGERPAQITGSPPLIDYFQVRLYDGQPRNRLEIVTPTVDTRLALHLLFSVQNGLDQQVALQVVAGENPDATVGGKAHAIGQTILIPGGYPQLVFVDLANGWAPYYGLVLTPQVVPTYGGLLVKAHVQQWYNPPRRE